MLKPVGFILIFEIKRVLQGFADRHVAHQGLRSLLAMPGFTTEVQIRSCLRSLRT